MAAIYADGILLCAENASKTLHKVSEIYDRIALPGGQVQRVRSAATQRGQHADIKGYQFSREDVDALLANPYAQYARQATSSLMK